VPRRETFRSTQTLGAGALVDRVLRFNVNYEPVSELSTIHESDVIWHCERYGDYANNQSCPRTSGYKKKKGAESIDSARRLTICAPGCDYAAIAILRSDLKPVRTSSEKICGCSQAAK
jgi:hypothetical protein